MISPRLLSGFFVSVLAAGALTLPAGPASALTGPIDCPTALPTSQAVDGLTGTGYTVERGTTPDPFSAKVLGRITDGIAPGIDLILADTSSPAITRAGGIWQGMSGSPVYTADGHLIGSVSYGLATTSSIAGITPASDMQKLLTVPAAATVKTKVKVSSSVVKRLVKTGAVSTALASQGFELLKTPISLSGAQGSRYAKFVNDLQKRTPNGTIHVGGARASAAPGSPSDITAGSNFAGALSYGAVTFAGIGTTTFVCSGKAVAFGHPFLGAGAVQFTAHTADAVTVQPDIFAPFKVANPGGVVGVVDQDRIPGIRAQLGATPTTFDVTTKLSETGGAPVTGKTTVVYQPFAADIAAIHTQTMIDSLRQSYGPGSATTSLQINGLRANGTAFSLRINDHIADSYDLSYAVADQVFLNVYQLLNQPFEKIKITGVSVTASDITDNVNLYRVTSLKVANSKGAWVKPPAVIKVSQGKVIKTQLTLTKYQSTDQLVVPISVRAPQGSSGLTGTLDVEGGLSGDFGETDSSSFAGLLKSLAAAPTYDQLLETLTLDTGGKPLTASSAKHIAGSVDPYSNLLDVQVK